MDKEIEITGKTAALVALGVSTAVVMVIFYVVVATGLGAAALGL